MWKNGELSQHIPGTQKKCPQNQCGMHVGVAPLSIGYCCWRGEKALEIVSQVTKLKDARATMQNPKPQNK